jgi:hypothetical protein
MEILNLRAERAILIPALQERIDFLETHGAKVQSQPLGFMRLPLRIGQRNNEHGQFVHAWMPGLPLQEGGPFPHTHVFHLTSRVVRGRVIDTLLQPVENPTGAYKLVPAKCSDDHCKPLECYSRVDLHSTRETTIEQDEVYEVPKGTFHTTTVLGVALTLIEKSNVDESDPILAIPVHTSIPQEQFRRDQLDQRFAWEKIRELLEM